MQIGRDSPNLTHSLKMPDTNNEEKAGVPPSAAKAPPKKKSPAPRKKSKKPKDMPKRPLSAYNIFFQIERKKLMEAREKGEIPDDFDMASVSSNSDGDEKDKKKRASLFQAIAQTIANRWKNLPSDERVKFEELAKEEMKKYRIKKDEYQQRMVRETLDGSGSGRSAAPARQPEPPRTPGVASTAMGGLPPGTAPYAHHGMLGPQTGTAPAPSVTVLQMPQSFSIQDYLQRRTLSGGEQFGLPPQDYRLQSMGLGLPPGVSMDRLLALRALQNDPMALRIDPSLLQGGGPGYLGGLPGGLDPRLVEQIRFQEGAAGLGGIGAPSGIFTRGPQASGQLPDNLPPEQLLRYLNARHSGLPPPPPGGFPGYGSGPQGR